MFQVLNVNKLSAQTRQRLFASLSYQADPRPLLFFEASIPLLRWLIVLFAGFGFALLAHEKARGLSFGHLAWWMPPFFMIGLATAMLLQRRFFLGQSQPANGHYMLPFDFIVLQGTRMEVYPMSQFQGLRAVITRSNVGTGHYVEVKFAYKTFTWWRGTQHAANELQRELEATRALIANGQAAHLDVFAHERATGNWQPGGADVGPTRRQPWLPVRSAILFAFVTMLMGPLLGDQMAWSDFTKYRDSKHAASPEIRRELRSRCDFVMKSPGFHEHGVTEACQGVGYGTCSDYGCKSSNECCDGQTCDFGACRVPVGENAWPSWAVAPYPKSLVTTNSPASKERDGSSRFYLEAKVERTVDPEAIMSHYVSSLTSLNYKQSSDLTDSNYYCRKFAKEGAEFLITVPRNRAAARDFNAYTYTISHTEPAPKGFFERFKR